MNFHTFSSYAALLYRFGLLLFAILPVTYGTPWLCNLLFIVIALCYIAVLPVSHWLYRRDYRNRVQPSERRRMPALPRVESHPRDRYYDAMICTVGLIIYSLTGVTVLIIIWAVVLAATIISIVANHRKDDF